MKILSSFLTLVIDQVLGKGTQATRKGVLKFTDKCKAKMLEHKVTEDMVSYVFHKGEQRKPQMLVKSFGGYEIGLYFFQDKKTLAYIITTVWKRIRR